MDLLEYRAMKAQEEAQKDSTQEGKVEQPNVQTQQSSTQPTEPIVQTKEQTQSVPTVTEGETTTQVESSNPTQPLPTFVEINGQKVSLQELEKGYLRQSDYTRKTQEVARQAREAQEALTLLEQVKGNPELAKQINYDPQQAHTRQVEQNYYDLLLEQEVSTLSTKYADFEVSEILDFALQNEMQNLEHAYLLNKQLKGDQVATTQTQVNTQSTNQPIDVEAIKAQIRAEILAEQGTSTIITSGGTPPIVKTAPALSEAQLRVAKNMNLTPEEYTKWI